MQILKSISGHTSYAGIYRYLTKSGRALARDFLNIDAPQEGGFDWAAVMDETRHVYRNDMPWGGRPARTYKHYVISPDPGDAVPPRGTALPCRRLGTGELPRLQGGHRLPRRQRRPHPARGRVLKRALRHQRRGRRQLREGDTPRLGLLDGRPPDVAHCQWIPVITKPPKGDCNVWSRGLDLNQ